MTRRDALAMFLGTMTLGFVGCSEAPPVPAGGPEEAWSDEVREAEERQFAEAKAKSEKKRRGRR